MTGRTGISNRETPEQEAQERHEHPPQNLDAPEPDDTAGPFGDALPGEMPDGHTSQKVGAKSIAQKRDRTRYPDRSMPATHKKAGAFGKEPRVIAADERGPEESEPNR
jgi:hypothetical protein